MARWIAIVLLIVVACAAMLFVTRPMPPAADHRLAWLATAHQSGPVGYRDPAGAISPNGKWIAYAEGRFLRVAPAGGGPIVDLPPGEVQIRSLSWHPDNRRILTDGYRTPAGLAVYDVEARTRTALWNGRESIDGTLRDGSITVRLTELRQASWSHDGQSLLAVVNGRDGQELWIIAADGASAAVTRMANRISMPASMPNGDVACVTTIDARPRLTIPCGRTAVRTDPALDIYGPLAFSPDGAVVYAASPNASATMDLWAIPMAGGRAQRLTSFSRDSYAPSVAADGAVVFKVQSYRTDVAVMPAGGGPSRPLAAIQSETPSWDPTGRWIGITYGTWRRVVDDAKYPDIAQEAGIISADAAEPATAPARVVHDSPSEDQSLCWSPNGKWIAFHSHKDQSDDIWLRPADGHPVPTRVSFLGRGAETGWPRWSPDGKWVLFDGMSRSTKESTIYVAGIDQDTGAVTSPPREVPIHGAVGEPSHAEWLGGSDRIAVVSKQAPGAHVIFTVARDGGDAQVLHRFATEHDAPGLAAAPDGSAVVFVAPAPDGFFQLFRLPVSGGAPMQLTNDPANKTQPAWSPDGRRIAFTVWNYDAQFWSIR
jgi:Tol biopolymer transport system component